MRISQQFEAISDSKESENSKFCRATILRQHEKLQLIPMNCFANISANQLLSNSQVDYMRAKQIPCPLNQMTVQVSIRGTSIPTFHNKMCSKC